MNKNTFFVDNNIEVMSGYFQSFRYFHPKYEKLIRQDFTFLPGVYNLANKILETAKQKRIDAVTDYKTKIGNCLIKKRFYFCNS